MKLILAIDDDRSVLHLISRAFQDDAELTVVCESTATGGLAAVRNHAPDVLLLDIVLPGTNGMQLFRRIREIDRKLPVIFITAEAESETAIEAMQLGAFDYVAKPLELPRLKEIVAKALKTRRLMNVPVAVPAEETLPAEGELFVGHSPPMLEVFKAIGRVARQDVTVLIRGESGTGKELVARALYQHSDRSSEPFVEVNCAAIPDNLLESELFGHEKGAFTGADRRRIGKFEQCHQGTILLDEVGDMSPLVQGKVLRLLQEQKFERVGGNETITTDVRILAATNRDLEAMVEAGKFRADLLYRLNGVTITLPPLRERGDDLPRLLQHFLSRASRDFNKQDIEGIAPEALDILCRYAWPGNVRELQSVIRQSVLNSTGTVIVPEWLPDDVHNHRPAAAGKRPDAAIESDLAAFVDRRLQEKTNSLYADAVEMMERYVLTRVLQETSGNQTRAAKILGITRGKIRDRIAAFGISLNKQIGIERDSG